MMSLSHEIQHSHIFLLDIGSLGDFKSKPGVNRIGEILRDIVSLTIHSSETFIKSLGIIISSQNEVKKLVSFAKPSHNALRAATSALKKIDTALKKAKALTEKGRENLKSALKMALESMDGLEGSLELHIVTALTLNQLDVLLSGAKASMKNVVGLKSVNIISPLTDQAEEERGSSSLMCRKIFSDEQDLQSHLRSALLCQPGDYPAIKLEVTDEDTGDILSLDLQPRSVHTEEEGELRELVVRRGRGAAGPRQLRVESSVTTAGLCQSLLTGAPLLARPTDALFLSHPEKKDNAGKVSALHSELASQGRSLVVRAADPHSGLHLLIPCCHLSRPPTFLLTAALTATVLLPFPPNTLNEDGEDTEETGEIVDTEDSEDIDVKKLLGRLPHYSSYDPWRLSKRRDQIRPGRVNVETQKPKRNGKMDSAKVKN